MAHRRCDLDFPLPTLVFDRLKQITRSSAGVIFAISSYLWWAFATPIYFKIFKSVPVVELVIWRILSGLPLLILLLFFRNKLVSCYKLLCTKKTCLLLLISAFLISVNWTVYVISVVTDRLLDSSLGYYITPLVTVSLGFLFLGERLRKLQIVAVFIALIGVVFLTISQGSLPWIAMSLAATFSLYGLMRKILGVGSVEGLAIEMTFALPVAVVLQWWLFSTQSAEIISGDWFITSGLLLGGIVTIIPLLLFASAATRLKLTTLGILQYISPSGQLILALFVYKESFDLHRGIVFGLIWLAVILYSFDTWRSTKMIRNNESEMV